MQNNTSSTPHGQQPLVSFIVPAYNLPAEALTACLDSILALSLRPAEREIIVVDDGSSTPALTALTAYEEHIIYIRQQNGGLSRARNTGLRMAAGRYVQFVDGDDLLLTTPYEHCLDMVRYGQPDMVMFNFTREPTPDVVFSDLPPMSGTQLLRHHNIRGTAWGYLFKRSVLGQLRFTPGIFHEDEEFTPLLLLRCDVVHRTDAPAYLYRQRDTSIMTSSSLRHRLKRLGDAQHILVRLQNISDTLPAEGRLALQRRVHQLTMDYLYNVILLTRSHHYLCRKTAELRRAGLYPLPKRDYTKKYNWFRRLANSEMGLKMLMRAIPLMNKEP